MDETGNWGVLDSSYFIVSPIKKYRPQGVACECLWCDVCVREIEITKLYFFLGRCGMAFFLVLVFFLDEPYSSSGVFILFLFYLEGRRLLRKLKKKV